MAITLQVFSFNIDKYTNFEYITFIKLQLFEIIHIIINVTDVIRTQAIEEDNTLFIIQYDHYLIKCGALRFSLS